MSSSTLRSLLLRRKGLVVGVLFLVVLSAGFFVSKPVSASYASLPDYLSNAYDQYISLKEDDPITHGGNYTPSLRFLVYTPLGSKSTTVKINNYTTNNKPRCEKFTVEQYDVTNDNSINNNGTSIANPITLSNGNEVNGVCNNYNGSGAFNGDGFTIGLDATKYLESDRFPGYAVTSVKIALRGGEDSLFADVQGVGNRLSYMGEQAGTSDHTQYPSAGVSYSRTGGWGPVEARFAPACGYNAGQQASLWWKDADSEGDPNNGNKVTYTLYEDGTAIKSGNALSGGDRHELKFTAHAGSKYKISFSPVKGRDNGTANTIKIWYPFDSASYYKSCPPTNSGGVDTWNVSWPGDDTYITRNGVKEQDYLVGDFNDPGASDAPQPGQAFNYYSQAVSDGEREITNLRYSKVCLSTPLTSSPPGADCAVYPSGATTHYRDYSTFYHLVNMGYDPPFTTAPPNYLSYQTNTQDITIKKYSTAAPAGVDAYTGVGTGVSPINPILTAGQSNMEAWTPGAGDGGQQRCMQAQAVPSHGKATLWDPIDVYNDSNGTTSSGKHTVSWATSGTATAPLLCVFVPYYYILSTNMTLNGSSTTQQGTAVSLNANVFNPAQTNNRNHTNSEAGPVKGVVELVVPSGTAAPTGNNLDPTDSTNQLPCAYMQSKVSPSSCSTQGDQTGTVNAGGPAMSFPNVGRADTSGLDVGTKLCYATYAQHPKNTDTNDVNVGNSLYKYSTIACTTIVKSPKVHFSNTDLVVGRHRSSATGCANPVGNATISTASAPTSKANFVTNPPFNGHMYGSWVEYGAFATGSISSFGSAAMPYGFNNGGVIQPQRLIFGNQGSLGNFNYSQSQLCTPNPFGDVTDNNTNLRALPAGPAQASFETSGANEGNLYLNELANNTNSTHDKTGYVSNGTDIKITPRSPTVYTADVSVEAKPHLFGADCPQLNITIFVSGVGTDSKPLDYCNGARYETKTVNLNLGTVGYSGPSKVRIEYVNDAWVGGDRNIEVRNVNVKFNNNNTQQTHNVKNLPVSNRVYGSYANPICESPGVVTPENGLMLHQSSASSAIGANGACYGVEIFRSPDLTNIASMPPPPNSLNNSYTGFQGRDIVLYSKKNDPTKGCKDPANATANGSGNITIDQDIIYKRTGFNNVSEMPRLVFIADCTITISDAVTEVNASLIAGDAIKTCSVQTKTKDLCNTGLMVRGSVSANRLLLWRTFGADLKNDDGTGRSAETFDLSPSQMIANYSRGVNSATFSTVDEVDLPPRY